MKLFDTFDEVDTIIYVICWGNNSILGLMANVKSDMPHPAPRVLYQENTIYLQFLNFIFWKLEHFQKYLV